MPSAFSIQMEDSGRYNTEKGCFGRMSLLKKVSLRASLNNALDCGNWHCMLRPDACNSLMSPGSNDSMLEQGICTSCKFT